MENCQNRVRLRFWREPRTLPARCFRAHPPSPMTPRVRPPAETSSTWPTSTHPAVGFSRGTNKLHAVPPWRQEWIATRPSSGPSIWAVLLHCTVIRSGLQRHRKVSRLRMVVELPPLQRRRMVHRHAPRSCPNRLATTAPSVYLHTTDQEIDAISTKSRLHHCQSTPRVGNHSSH